MNEWLAYGFLFAMSIPALALILSRRATLIWSALTAGMLLWGVISSIMT